MENSENNSLWFWLLIGCAAVFACRRGGKADNTREYADIESYVEPQPENHAPQQTAETETETIIATDENVNQNNIFNPWYLGFRRDGLGV